MSVIQFDPDQFYRAIPFSLRFFFFAKMQLCSSTRQSRAKAAGFFKDPEAEAATPTWFYLRSQNTNRIFCTAGHGCLRKYQITLSAQSFQYFLRRFFSCHWIEKLVSKLEKFHTVCRQPKSSRHGCHFLKAEYIFFHTLYMSTQPCDSISDTGWVAFIE